MFNFLLHEDIISDNNWGAIRAKLLIFITLVTSATTAYYFYIYTNVHSVSEYNGYFISAIALNFFNLFLLKYKGCIKTCSHLFMFITSALIISLLYAAGGVNAPGLLWLIAIPVLYSILIGKRGAIYASIIIIVTLCFYIFQHDQIVRDSFFNLDFFFRERIRNFILFSLFSSAIIYFSSREIQEAEFALQRTNEEIESLLKVVIHDISTPLSIIALNLAKAQIKDGLTKEDIQKMDKAYRNVTQIIDGVREFKAASSGKQNRLEEKTSVKKASTEVIELLKDRCARKELTIKLDSNEEHFVYVPESLFKHQVLMNLLTNAIKFSSHGGLIEIKTEKQDSKISITITDQGVGIPKNIIDSLFNSHKQTNRKGTDGERGTGFGFIILKQYLDHYDAQIEIQSSTNDENSGTKIKLSFPSWEDPN